MGQAEPSEPSPGRGMSRRGSALVIARDPRTTVAVTLLLQEMDLAVDLGLDVAYAARWMRHARYDIVALGIETESGPLTAEHVAQLRATSPATRLLLLGEPSWEAGLAGRLGVEVVPLPLRVNDLVERVRPAA